MGKLSRFAGNITGGLIGTSSTERIAPQLAGLSEETKKEVMAETGEAWVDIKDYLQPYLDVGRQALTDYRAAIGAPADAPVFGDFEFDPSKIEESPAYQFVKDQTMQAVTRMGAKGRRLTSGNIMTEMADYTRGLASQEYGNEFQRQLQKYKTGVDVKTREFDIRNMLQRQRVGDVGSLVDISRGAGRDLSTFRQNIAGMRTGAITGAAAERGAAMLLPVQERQQFVQGLMSAGGRVLGGMASGGTGFFA